MENARKNPEGSFLRYKNYDYQDGNKILNEKISFVKDIPEFGWVVGSGFYLQEVEKILFQREEELKNRLKETVMAVVATSIMIIFVILMGMFFISKKLRLMLQKYERNLLVNNRQIRSQKKVFQTLFEKSTDGILIMQEDVCVDCNEAIVKMFRAKSKNDLIGLTLQDISPEFQDDGENSAIKAKRTNQMAYARGVHKFEWIAKAFDEELFWISIVLTTIEMEDGTIQHYSIRNITARKRLELENERQREQLLHQIKHDTLTNLPNRVLLSDRLSQAIKKADRDKKIVAVLFVDIDKFKIINDTLGHESGDMVLVKIADRLRQNIRQTDTAARLSGDEFIVLIDGCEDVNSVILVVKKIISAFQEPFLIKNESLKVTTSMGISIYPNDGESAQKLLKNADIAMYKAKQEGKNRYKFFAQSMNDETVEHIEMEKNIILGLSRGEFLMYYQPQINIINGNIVGFEALIRWIHPEKGFIPPSYFIPIAEESDLIIDLGDWVLKEAMTQISKWYNMGLNPGKVAINFAGKQLESSGLFSLVEETLKSTQCKPEWIEIEIVERFIMKDVEKSIALLSSFRDLNIDISIDDFGTGYSSLAYLKHLPITKLKIDQSFVRNLSQSREDRAIAKTIIELGKGLGLKVLAEGVENEEEQSFLSYNGCELMQGYLFGKPLPADKAQEMLEAQ
ncbi:MAG: EAL domain-containing protein [Sulfurospirillaceae bacterium]|nr:EAL domain-containing protein [Sulfurospirillaceae bacterium]